MKSNGGESAWSERYQYNKAKREAQTLRRLTDADILPVYDLLFPIGQEYVRRIERVGEYHIEAMIEGNYTEEVMREMDTARLAGSRYRLARVYVDKGFALIRVESPL